MPTYEYQCDACGRTFDYFQSMNDPRLEVCILDSCKGKVTRLLGRGAGIIFKGSGFYETDYRSDSYKSAAKADSGTSSGGDSTSSTSKDGGSSSTPASSPSPSPAPASTSSS